uniref:Uncharacterized protein n=1 Tax=Ascaris lumbricoides TaxID=6252 RepID=A0A0M3I7K4_ASCLU
MDNKLANSKILFNWYLVGFEYRYNSLQIIYLFHEIYFFKLLVIKED